MLPILTALATLALAAPAAAAPPANDDIANAIAIRGTTQPAAQVYSLNQATVESGEGTFSGAEKDTVWFKWSPNGTGAAYAGVCYPPNGSHFVKVWRLNPNARQQGISDLIHPGTWASDNPVKQSTCRARWKASSANTYLIQVDRNAAASFVHQLRSARTRRVRCRRRSSPARSPS